MRFRSKIAAAATSGIMAAGALATFAPQAHADTAVVSTTVAGTITVTTPPTAAVLVPPTSLPGNATGTSLMTVTSNTAYNIQVHSSAATLVGTTNPAHTLAGSLSVVPSVVSLATTTLSNLTLSTSNQKVANSTGGAVDAYTFTFSQPIAASDPLDVYTTTLTYTVGSGL
jgi:hypothetical protein